MSRVYLFSRCVQIKNLLFNIPKRALSKVQSSSGSSDDEGNSHKKINEEEKSKVALQKLNNLLKTMIEDDVAYSKAKLNLAKPVGRRRKDIKPDEKLKSPKVESSDKQIVKAVQDVAESLGGDVKQTESELLSKLLNSTTGDKVSNLSDVIKGMQIEHEHSPSEQSKAQQVRQILYDRNAETKSDVKLAPRTKRPPKTDLTMEKIDLFGSEPLGIFAEGQTDVTEGVENKTWNSLYQRDLKLAVTHPPSNYFQQMILWTEQGKVWRFPIDNEQGLEQEKKIYFAEHVFLEKYLEPWCPAKGPLRHFMELVCVGLSKNPYLTVEAKKEHIHWFKNYFEDKKQLLKETGAIPDANLGDGQVKKQIEH